MRLTPTVLYAASLCIKRPVNLSVEAVEKP